MALRTARLEAAAGLRIYDLGRFARVTVTESSKGLRGSGTADSKSFV